MTTNYKKRILFVNEFSKLATGFSTYGYELISRVYQTDEFEICEYASYLDPTNPLQYEVPWDVVPVIPHPQDNAAMKEYNSVKDAQFGSLKFADVCMKFKPDFVVTWTDAWMCFVNTGITMSDGKLRDISIIKIGDKVLSKNGVTDTVAKLFPHAYRGKMRKIKLTHTGEFLQTTPNHIFYTIPYAEKSVIGNIVEKPASELMVKDKVLIPINSNNIPCNFSDDALFAMGFFVAEGCYLKGKNKSGVRYQGIQFAMNSNEYPLIEKITKGILELDGNANKHKVRIRKNTKAMILRYGCYKCANFLHHNFGDLAKNKFLPQWVMDLPKEQLAKFLQGLLVGDGTYSTTTNCGKYYTVSPDLSYQVFLAMLKCGVTSSRNRGTTVYKQHRFNRFLLNSAKHSGFKYLYEMGIPNPEAHPLIVDNYFVASISSIDEVDYEGMVYDFETEQTHNYSAGCLVHNCEYQFKHPFRPYFKSIYMPCIDGEPQKNEWLHQYRQGDVRTSYSEWAANIMRNAGMSVEAITYPGSNPDVFKPVTKADKEDIRARLGFPPDSFVIQTVMRNQPRKLYPDLLRTFKRFLQVCQENGRNEIADKTFLHLHTYLNDVGFDIAAEIQKYHLGHKVLLTYQDMETKQYEVSFYKGIHPTFLRNGKKPVSITPNTGGGLDKTQLAELMGVADLYIQYSVAGACEMPIIDAKSCGIPVMAPAYAAMAEQMIDGGGIPLKVARFYQENRNETGQRRALPDEEYAAQAIYKFFNSPQTYRDELGEQARQCVLSKYTWDGCADKWLKIFRETPILDRSTTWDSPAFVHTPNLEIPSVASDEHFVELAYQYIVGRPWVLSWETKRGIVNLLKIGTWNQNGKEMPFNRSVLVQQLLGLNKNINQLEVARANHGKPQERSDNTVGFISI